MEAKLFDCGPPKPKPPKVVPERPHIERKDCQCPACDGSGEMLCWCCDNEVRCDECDGTGLDPTIIKIKEYRRAERKFYDECPPRSAVYWNLVVDEKVIGIRNATRELAYRDVAYRRQPS